MSSRKKRRKRSRDEELLLEGLFGEGAARYLRLGSALAITVLFVGGCVLFVEKSQTFGSIGIVTGAAWLCLWITSRWSAKGRDPFEVLRTWRPALIGVGGLVVVAGWVVFFAAWEELGLLLVTLGALPTS